MSEDRPMVPRQDGKTIVITGANTGIGRHTALALARAGARVVLAGRSLERTEPVLRELRALDAPDPEFVELDLGRLASVYQAAGAVTKVAPTIDILINNAGLAGHRGRTADGFEIQFGVNHLGPFLFTLLLLEHATFPEASRIVTVASRAHTRVPTLDLEHVTEPTRSRTGFKEYCNSKLANVLFSWELSRRMAGTGVRTYSLHPGVVATDIWRRIPSFAASFAKRFMITAEEGAQTTLYCATSPEVDAQSGFYYSDCELTDPSKAARNLELSQRLWDESLDWVGLGDPSRARVSAD